MLKEVEQETIKGKPFVKKDEVIKKNLCFKYRKSGHQAAALLIALILML
jgi:hypothetical protein